MIQSGSSRPGLRGVILPRADLDETRRPRTRVGPYATLCLARSGCYLVTPRCPAARITLQVGRPGVSPQWRPPNPESRSEGLHVRHPPRPEPVGGVVPSPFRAVLRGRGGGCWSLIGTCCFRSMSLERLLPLFPASRAGTPSDERGPRNATADRDGVQQRARGRVDHTGALRGPGPGESDGASPTSGPRDRMRSATSPCRSRSVRSPDSAGSRVRAHLTRQRPGARSGGLLRAAQTD